MGVMVSSSHVVSAAPSSSGGGLLTLFPCSSMKVLLTGDSSPQTSPTWVLSRAAALHKLPQRESLPQGEVLEEQAAPAWVPYGVTSPASKPALAWAPLSLGLQVLAGACSSAGLPTGSQLPLGIYLLRRGVPSTDYRKRSAPLWTSMDCRGTTCLTMVFITSCKGRLSAPTFWAPPSPLLLHWPWCLQGCFSHIISLLSLNCRLTPEIFSSVSWICYHRGATTVTHWFGLGLGQQWVRLRAS